MEESIYSGSMNSILYSNLDTEAGIFSENTGTFNLEHLGYGDSLRGRHQLKQLYPEKHVNPFESLNTYRTPKQDHFEKPFQKLIADRYEAEYNFVFRWAADRKMKAIKVIPFESNFYSVVRLIFKGRNWVLDCANYDGQYDYCGWLPSLSGTVNKNCFRNDFITDSSAEFDDRETAGRSHSVHPSDTNYGIATIPTDYSDILTKQPIDPIIYKLMGHDDITSQLSNTSQFHSNFIDLPSTDSAPITAKSEGGEIKIVEKKSKSSSLDNLFEDLIQLDKLFAKQVENAEQYFQNSSFNLDFLNNTQTAQSFSNIKLCSSQSVTVISEKESKKETNGKNILNQLICLTGRKLNFDFLRKLFALKNSH